MAERSKSARGAASYQAPATEKAIDVLEFLAEAPDGVSLAELCRALGRKMGELYRVVLALERRGFVYKDSETDTYFLSLRLFELAHKHPPIARLLRNAQPVMDELALQTMQSCHLIAAQGGEARVLANAESPLPMQYTVKVGASFPLLETSSGVVLMAFATRSQTDAILAVESEDGRTSLEERFAAVRRLGHEVWESRIVRGATNLSAPIFDHLGRARAALTIPYLEQSRATVSIEESVNALAAAANGLSHRLGANTTDTRRAAS